MATDTRPPFVLVGGVPGAGKSTALARVAAARPAVRVVDTEASRRRWRDVLGPRVPYALYRPLVHARHGVLQLGALLAGPAGGTAGLCVHDPATRPVRRAVLALLARARGWDPVLVVVDVDREAALAGQVARGRVVRPRAFARHWRRWDAQRGRLRAAAASGSPHGGWSRVHVAPRREAATLLRHLLGPSQDGQDRQDAPAGTGVACRADRPTHSRPASTHSAAAPHHAGS